MIKLGNTIKRQFVTGIVVLLPLGLTILIIFALFQLVGRFSSPLVYRLGILRGYPRALMSLFSFSAIIIIIWFIGMIATNIIVRRLVAWFENLLLKMPGIRPIYTALRQIIETIMLSKKAFHKVVLVEYPRKGIYTLAFVTNKFEWEKREMVSLFIPTTPNPTSGWFVIMSVKEIIELSMSVEEGMKLLISGGIVTPDSGRFSMGMEKQENNRIGGEDDSIGE